MESRNFGAATSLVASRSVVFGSALALGAVLMALPASATTYNSTGVTFTSADGAGLDLGTDATYAFIDLGSGTTLGWNSGPENGNVLVGNGVTVSSSGGNNGGLNGHTLYYDSTTKCNPSPCSSNPPGGKLANPPATQLVSSTTTSNALSTAQNVSKFATSLSSTLSLTATELNGTTVTINGTSGLNVIDIPSLHNVKLALDGPSNAFFVFNVTGELQTNEAITLSGGVTAANVLWNLTGSSGQVLNTSGGDSLIGTFLATDGGQFQFSELVLDGEFINTDGNVQLASGSQIGTAAGFTVPPTGGGGQLTTPLPAGLPLFAAGLAGLGLLGWRRRRKPQAVA